VWRYLSGRGPITRFWHRKHDALSGFWRFAIQRGYTDWSPVPSRRPKEPTPFVPHIYTQEELRRLLDGTTTYQKKWYKLEPVSLRAILLLLYGAGLRVSEAINLTCADVNLPDAILTIRLTKFYKTRHVAINAQLCCVLSDYDINRRTNGSVATLQHPFSSGFIANESGGGLYVRPLHP
jgi:site-specific recombinase XerD